MYETRKEAADACKYEAAAAERFSTAAIRKASEGQCSAAWRLADQARMAARCAMQAHEALWALAGEDMTEAEFDAFEKAEIAQASAAAAPEFPRYAARPAPEARRPLRKDRYPPRRDQGAHDLLHREQRMDRTAGGRAHRKTLRGRYDRGAKETQIRTAAASQNTGLRSLFSCVLSANSAFLVWTFPFFSGLIVLPKAKETSPP